MFFELPPVKQLVPAAKPRYGRPVELCCYSLNEQRVQSFDRSGMVRAEQKLFLLLIRFSTETIQA